MRYTVFMPFLATTLTELYDQEIWQPDFIVVSADAYVDHPSFGAAVVARLVESQGFSVAVLAQPVTNEDFKSLGEPKHAFLVSTGVVDSMVNNYSVSLNRRTEDVYSENGKMGRRPDRVCEVYCKALKKLFPDSPVIAGGIEPSLRRLAHYDYWSNSVRHSIVYDAPADLIIYGMGEVPIMELCHYAKRNVPLDKVKDIKGTAYLTDIHAAHTPVKQAILENDTQKFRLLSSYARVVSDKKIYAKAYIEAKNANRNKGLIQKQDNEKYVVVNAPPQPPTTKLLDFVASLPYMRTYHPMYQHVPAIEEVQFSVTAHRGCFGDCSFCALNYHQGKAISHRSDESILAEIETITQLNGFKGYIHDVGGPSANFHVGQCSMTQKGGSPCVEQTCIGHKPCKNLNASHTAYINLLRKARAIKGVKKVFVRSGVRFDFCNMDTTGEFLNELAAHHISGQLKVAPEHVSDNVLRLMNKPPHAEYIQFSKNFQRATRRAGKEQYLVPYFVSSHPGCTLKDAAKLTEFLMELRYMPLQVQDFYPTPGTLSTTMYYTETDPRTGEKLYVAKTKEEKAMQRALMQYRMDKNRGLVVKALKLAGREDLLKQL